MTASAFILGTGGFASIGGTMPEAQRGPINAIVKSFIEKVGRQGLDRAVPASKLGVKHSNFILIARDVENAHVVFVDHSGQATINYVDLVAHGRVQLESVVHQVRLEIGDPHWAFSFSLTMTPEQLEPQLEELAAQYIETRLELDALAKGQGSVPSDVSLSHPELSAGLEKFRKDHSSKRTAFLMMQFTKSAAHAEIATTIKDTLAAHGIVALRADDKEYMDDLFPNIRVYMHACDFGVAVFERIDTNDFNPNVSLEVGYMLGLGKSVLLLKDKTLKALSTDLAGKLYREFDTRDVASSLPPEIRRWLRDKGLE